MHLTQVWTRFAFPSSHLANYLNPSLFYFQTKKWLITQKHLICGTESSTPIYSCAWDELIALLCCCNSDWLLMTGDYVSLWLVLSDCGFRVKSPCLGPVQEYLAGRYGDRVSMTSWRLDTGPLVAYQREIKFSGQVTSREQWYNRCWWSCLGMLKRLASALILT